MLGILMPSARLKGTIGELMIMTDILMRGYDVALPYTEGSRYDLIVERNGKFERIQCKYTTSNGELLEVRCYSQTPLKRSPYTKKDIDWIAVYDKTTNCCYYVPSKMFKDGRRGIYLRLTPTINKQEKDIHWAKDFLRF